MIRCSHYSDQDETVILKASSLGLPVIGGTALELWASHLGKPLLRKRSDNDLDFVCFDCNISTRFISWCKKNTDPDKVQVDLYMESNIIANDNALIATIDGVLVMSLEYLIWSKLQRHSAKDIQDIRWMLNVIENYDSLELWIERLGVTDDEVSLINSIINDEISNKGEKV